MSPRSGTSARGAGRVIAGTARGLRLEAPPGEARPLGDRLKEALFAMLEPELRGCSFLDLFAGSGAAGIEALSRGASRAVFIDRDPAAIATISRNVAAARVGEGAVMRRAEAVEWLRTRGADQGAFDVVLADPPYDDADSLGNVLSAISSAGPGRLLAHAGVIVAKHGRRSGPAARIGLLASVRERQFGESALTFLRWAADDQETP